VSGVCDHCGDPRCGRWTACSRGRDSAPRTTMTYRERLSTLTLESVDDFVAVQNGTMSMDEKRKRDARRLASGPVMTDEERSWFE
jgi:hypothetical protein